jgi:acyl carrier protein
MGLDAVDIVIEVEGRFGITIRDDEAENIRSVSDLLSIINMRIAAARHAACPNLSAFLRIRTLTREFIGQPSLRLRPSTEIASVMPANRRKQFWCLLRDLYGSAPPPLRRPKMLRRLLVALSLFAVVSAAYVATFDSAYLSIGVFAVAAFIIVLYLVTTPFRTELPTNFSTFGDLSRRLVGISVATGPSLTEPEVLAAVRKICADILGVDYEKVVPSARFVEDLGLG